MRLLHLVRLPALLRLSAPLRLPVAALFLLALAGCGPHHRDWSSYGDPIAAEPEPVVIKASQLLGEPARFNGQTVVVEGEVIEVCQNKGCWMTFMDGDREMRIRFKDYAFFVPKDCGGKKARVAGLFEVKDVPADEARHYLEDAGRHAEAEKITGPVPSYTFMASGVMIES
ncbi:MAG TPA: DUF4920 domain-containing protein [Candidatus Eisenbacteria bacterium]